MIKKVGMTVKYNVISYLIGEGFKNIFKNIKSTISALTTMCLCMLMFGLFFIIGENINNIMNTIEDAQGMKVYFRYDLEEDKIKELEKKVIDYSYDLDLEYDILLSPIIENIENYNNRTRYMAFYKNIEKEGVLLNG